MYPRDIYVTPGQHVTTSDVIALVGSSGQSTGCHLHFEILVDGATVDPEVFLAARGTPLGN
jgi:murein DD-endopeptidase MepM/ murein hydrolase activator NlpD